MTPRVVIASGGTGGHFYPTLAIARELRRQGAEVALLVAGQHAGEHLALAAGQDLSARAIPAFRWPAGALARVVFPWRSLQAVRAARRELRSLRPDLLLGMGSFAAVPACLAARWEGVPLVLHEGNAWMGRANRFLSRGARAAGLSLPLVEGCAVRCPTVLTGMPLREALVQAAQGGEYPVEFAAAAGLQRARRTVLAFGGSQGARFLNETLSRAVACLGPKAPSLQVLHLTGTDDNEALLTAYAAAGVAAWVRRADSEIQRAYLAADLVICRAGASSLCELALFGKPSVLIPLPSAAEDHQTANARLAAGQRAAVHLPQAEASPERLAGLLADWLADPAPLAALGQALRALAVPDAAARMARLCLETLSAAGRVTGS